MIKKRLFTPGPTPIPEEVNLRMAQPVPHHRSAAFKALYGRVQAGLQHVFQTGQDVLMLSCSGSGAAEAAITNLFGPGEKGIGVSLGKFSARWADMMRRFGMEVVEIAVEWGQTVQTEQVREALQQHPDAACVWLVHSETSTGTALDLQNLAALVRAHSDALLCVDGVTSVLAHECPMDAWGIDVLFSASQKGFMVPPGLAFIALSDRAWRKSEQAGFKSYYFNLHAARKSAERNTSPWTPTITPVLGLECALDMIIREGLANVQQRHARNARGLRGGIRALGLELFGNPPSHALTALRLPPAAAEFQRILREEHGIQFAAGQDHIKDKIIRIGHLGWYDEGDMLTVLSAMEQTLAATGYDVADGAGVMAAQKIFMESARRK